MPLQKAFVFGGRQEHLTAKEFAAIAHVDHVYKGGFDSPEEREYLVELAHVNVTATPIAPTRLEDMLSRRAFSVRHEGSVCIDPFVADVIERAKQCVMLHLYPERPGQKRDLRDFFRIVRDVAQLIDGSFEFSGTYYDQELEILARPPMPELDTPRPPDAMSVARRALILCAARKNADLINQEGRGISRPLIELQEWTFRVLGEELSPPEREYFKLGPATWGIHARLDYRDRFEAVPILTWALGLTKLAKADQPADATLSETLGLNADSPAALEKPSLRPLSEIESLRQQMEELDDRLARADFSSDDEEKRYACDTIFRERRRAVRWLLGLAPSYAEASSRPFGAP